MQAFFSRRSKMTVSRPVAHTLNTLNILGPVLLFLATLLLGSSAIRDWPHEEKQFLIGLAALLIAAALLIRIIWGIAISVVRRKQTANHRPRTTTDN